MSTTTVEYVRTPRLICERLQAHHLGELEALLLDPRVAKTLWPSLEPPSKNDIAHSLDSKIDHWQRHGFGMWLVRDRESGAMVGRGGLQYTYVADVNEVEAGWAIVPERWGEGLGTELANACVTTACNDLGLLRLVAFTLPHNVASRRVMEKAGFAYDRKIVHMGLPHVLYVKRNARR
jgi:RimJ/RimL family protein N-acetyltransferase